MTTLGFDVHRQANIVGLIVNAYLSLEASSSSILSGSQALADALVVVNVSYRMFKRGGDPLLHPSNISLPRGACVLKVEAG